MIFIFLLAHITFNFIFGWSLLTARRHKRTWLETAVLSVLLGMYVETLAVPFFMFLGMSLVAAGIAAALGMTGVIVALLSRSWKNSPRLLIQSPKWYEWVLFGVAGEKILFAVWQ